MVFLGPALVGALAALTLPACGTEEIRTDQTVVSYTPDDPTTGELLFALAPTAGTYDQQLADSRANKKDASYHLLIDGKELVFDENGSIRPLVVGRGGAYGAGFHAAGAHHFTLVAPGGSTAIETDGVIASGALTRIYLFGPSDALQTRLVSYHSLRRRATSTSARSTSFAAAASRSRSSAARTPRPARRCRRPSPSATRSTPISPASP
jgi:hypothetical protein